MADRNPMMECLGRYSKSNLALMIYDNQHELAGGIWEIAGRRDTRAAVAADENCGEFIQSAKNSATDGILFRRVENLSLANQLYLADALNKMSPHERGKIIFTTSDFGAVAGELLTRVCKIKFSIQKDASRLRTELNYFDYQPGQAEVERYF